jgi:hypothetical protein
VLRNFQFSCARQKEKQKTNNSTLRRRVGEKVKQREHLIWLETSERYGALQSHYFHGFSADSDRREIGGRFE